MAPKKMPWFRFYVEAFSDPKLRRMKPEHRWLWVAVLGAARTSPVPGVLLLTDDESWSAADLADFAGLPERAVAVGMAAFVRAGIVQVIDETWQVVKWDDRQHASDTSTDRVRRHRERSNGPVTVMERSNGRFRNAPEAETESEAESEPCGSSEIPATRPEPVAAEPPPEVDIAQEVNRAVRLYSQTKASQEVRANGGDVDRLAAAIGKAALTDGRVEDLRQLVESGMTAEDAAAARADGLFGITSTATPQTVSDEELQAQRDQQEAKRLAMLAAVEAERDAPRGDHATGLAEARRAVVGGAHQ